MPGTQLVICGSIAIDRIMAFSGHYRELIKPENIDVLSLSVLVDSMTQAHGGIGPNIASAAAALGEKPVLLGSIGGDAIAYRDELSQRGIDTSHVHVSDLPTASFTAFTDADNNQVAGFYPGAMSDSGSLSLAPWSGQDALVCISAHDPGAMRRQVTECKQHNLRLFYDPGQQVSNVSAEDLAAGVEAAEVVALNEYEKDVLCDKLHITEAELAGRVKTLIITHGARGSVITGTAHHEEVTVPVAKPSVVVDPTGAGDAYRAGFLYGYLRQWDVKVCAQLGSVLASFILEQAGTQVSLAKDAIQQRYQETYNEEVQL